MDKEFKIAQVSAAHGIRGEVKLACFLENPKDIGKYNPLTTRAGKQYTVRVTGQTNDHVIVKIEGVADRNAAELLRGLEFYAPAARRPKLKKNEYFIAELVGFSAVLENGARVGEVIAFHNFGAGDIIEIAIAGDTIMLPFRAPFIGKIEDGKIVVTLPEYVGGSEKEAD